MRTVEEIKRDIANHRSVLAMMPGFAWELGDIAKHEKAIAMLEEELRILEEN